MLTIEQRIARIESEVTFDEGDLLKGIDFEIKEAIAAVFEIDSAADRRKMAVKLYASIEAIGEEATDISDAEAGIEQDAPVSVEDVAACGGCGCAPCQGRTDRCEHHG